jgi:glyoxylase-like metal-dependent hydrolase (beta-lactamase superfamily II)
MKDAMNISTLLPTKLSLICLLSMPLFATAQNYTIGTFTSPAKTFSTASYWVVGPQSNVLIDTQFLPKEGLLAFKEAERRSGKKVSHALILHPNPDKFNGTAVLQANGVVVQTSKQVLSAIPGVHTIRLGWFAEEYKPDYPAIAAQPTVFGDRTQEVDWGGVKIKMHVLGAGASVAHVVAQVGDAVFAGDLINPDNHAWLELGMIDEWLLRLAEIKALGAQRIFPGRGKAGGAELIDKQANYLKFVQKTIQAEQPSGTLGWFTKLKLQRTIEQEYPQLTYTLFMRDGLAAAWDNEVKKRAKR